MELRIVVQIGVHKCTKGFCTQKMTGAAARESLLQDHPGSHRLRSQLAAAPVVPVFAHAVGSYSTKLPKAECVPPLRRLALPRVSHYGEIALAGSRRLRSKLAAAPVLFAHAVVIVAGKCTSTTPTTLHIRQYIRHP